MGGKFEDTIESKSDKDKGARVVESGDILTGPPQPKVDSSLPQLPPQTQSIRQHFDDKKTKTIHLHVDAENLKVEIPPVQMEMILSDIRRPESQNERSFYDQKNNTVARFVSGLNAEGKFDIWVGVETAPEVNEGPVIGKLEKLITSTLKKKNK